MHAILFGFIGIIFACTGFAAEALGYRDLVAPDTEQDDLFGRVKAVTTCAWEVDDEGRRKLTARRERTYDEQGYLLESVETQAETKEEIRVRRAYAANGNLNEETEAAGEEATRKTIRLVTGSRKVVKEAEHQGRKVVLEEVAYDAFKKESWGKDARRDGTPVTTYEIVRDGNGKETLVTFQDPGGAVTDLLCVEWDQRGFTTREEHDSRTDGFTAVSVYEYPRVDAQGNWLERADKTTFYEDGELAWVSREVRERTIEYY